MATNGTEQLSTKNRVMWPMARTGQAGSRGVAMHSSRIFLYIVCLLLLSLPSLSLSLERPYISIGENDNYENIVISIGNDVPHDNCTVLITNLKETLKRASLYLHEVSGGRLSFGIISILLPFHWKIRACDISVGEEQWIYTTRSQVGRTTLQVVGSDTVFGNTFWTANPHRCGVGAEKIYGASNYIRDMQSIYPLGPVQGHKGSGLSVDMNASSLSSFNEGARAFASRWITFRYANPGEENEITPGPLQLLHSIRCALMNGTCPQSNQEIGRKSNCMFVAKHEHHWYEHSNVTSLTIQEMQNVSMLCQTTKPSLSYEKTPTLPCNGKPGEDFERDPWGYNHTGLKPPITMVPTPLYKLLQLSHVRCVIVWIQSCFLDPMESRALFLAAKKFILADLPDGADVGLVAVSGSTAEVVSYMTSMGSPKLRREFANKLPLCFDAQQYPNTSVNVQGAMAAAVDIFRHDNQSASNGLIIFVTPSTVYSTSLDRSAQILKENNVTLTMIEFPFSSGAGNISVLGRHEWGTHFAIPAPFVQRTEGFLQAQVNLGNAFLTISNVFNEYTAGPYTSIIHQEEFTQIGLAKGNFIYGLNGSSSTPEFLIFVTDPIDPKINNLTLRSPTGQVFHGVSWNSDLTAVGVIKVGLPVKQAGMWGYEFNISEDANSSCVVQVTERRHLDEFQVELFTSAEANTAVHLSTAPLILYMKVWYRSNPVIGADVCATVRIGGEKYAIKLLDTGAGDPDLTKWDGIYSQYFIPLAGFSENMMQISAQVTLHPKKSKLVEPIKESFDKRKKLFWSEACCGSLRGWWDPALRFLPAPHYGKFIPNRLLHITGSTRPELQLPGNIGDLRVVEINSANLTTDLQWTAPREFDNRTITSYRILHKSQKANQSWSRLWRHKGSRKAGEKEYTRVRFSSAGIFQICVQAMSEGIVGNRSNVVTLGIGHWAPKRTTQESTESFWHLAVTFALYSFIGSVIAIIFMGFIYVLYQLRKKYMPPQTDAASLECSGYGMESSGTQNPVQGEDRVKHPHSPLPLCLRHPHVSPCPSPTIHQRRIASESEIESSEYDLHEGMVRFSQCRWPGKWVRSGQNNPNSENASSSELHF